MPRPDRGWVPFTGTVSSAVKDYLEMKADDWEVDSGIALDVIVWKSCFQPSREAWRDEEQPEEVLERSFGEDALEALQDKRTVSLLEERLFPDEAKGGKRRKTQALLNRWRKFRLIDQEYKSSVLEVMHAVGKKPSVEKWTAVDDDWFDPPIAEE